MRDALLTLAIAAAASAGLSGCAQTPAQAQAAASRAAADRQGLDRELAGLVPEKSSGCLNTTETRNAEAVKAYGPTIVYRIGRNLKYRSDTAGGCENLARGDTLVTVSNSGQLCRGDIARTVDTVQRFQTGTCSFGDFVRYSRPR